MWDEPPISATKDEIMADLVQGSEDAAGDADCLASLLTKEKLGAKYPAICIKLDMGIGGVKANTQWHEN